MIKNEDADSSVPALNSMRRHLIGTGIVAASAALVGSGAGARPVHADRKARATIRTGFFDTGATLRYQLSGTGRTTVVLLHEMGMSLEGWDAVAPSLERHYSVVRYDLRGFGLSEKIVGSVNFENHVEDLRRLLSEVVQPAGEIILVGAALGGAVAIRFAAAHPSEAKAVIALSPALGVQRSGQQAAFASADELEKKGVRAWVTARLGSEEFASIRTNPAQLARFCGLQFAADPASWAKNMRMIAAADFTETYARVACPTLIVGARAYAGRPPAAFQAAVEKMRNARFESLNTGHFMAFQSPELVIPLIENEILRARSI